MATSDGGIGSALESPHQSKKRMSPHDQTEDVEANPDFNSDTRAKTPAGPGAQPSGTPSASAVPTENNWQRKRSSLLLHAMHPDGARETATFVEGLPRSTALRVILALFAYALLVSDVPRAGSSVTSLPFVQIEPNVFTVYGPTALPSRTLFQNGTVATDGVSASSSKVSTALYKFTPSSYGLRTVRDLLEGSPRLDSSWPTCLLSAHSVGASYSSDCGDSLPAVTVFNMLDTLVEAVAANAPSTTSYKNVAQTEEGIAIMARGELSSLPQRVCFSARAKARWTAHGGIAVDDRDARILEANEVEPVPTFMLLRSETLDGWKMNLEGVYSDMLAVALAAIIYVFVILTLFPVPRELFGNQVVFP
ncbi:hypothetical protein PRIC2_008811 [Phytophthora ramorum]